MSCNDLDRLRTESLNSSSTAWPADARQHLASCERCSRLQASLESSSPAEAPSEALLSRLEAGILPGLRAVSPLPGVLRVAAMFLLISIVVIAIANWRLGLAGWYARSALQASVNFTLLAAGLLAISNALARQMMPGSRRFAAAPLYISVVLLSLLTADILLFGYRWSPNIFPLALSCWEIGITCAAISAPLFGLILRRGLSLNPIAHGATAGLLAGLVGVTVLEIYCPYLDRVHTSVAHVGAAVTAAMCGAALGGIKKQNSARRGVTSHEPNPN